jgi:mannonate dehydratase
LHEGRVYEPAPYIRRALALIEAARTELGDEVELLHDVHERITPTQAIQFAKDVEQFRLFFLEDPLSPEDIGYFRIIASNPRSRSRWASCSTAPTNGRR